MRPALFRLARVAAAVPADAVMLAALLALACWGRT